MRHLQAIPLERDERFEIPCRSNFADEQGDDILVYRVSRVCPFWIVDAHDQFAYEVRKRGLSGEGKECCFTMFICFQLNSGVEERRQDCTKTTFLSR